MKVELISKTIGVGKYSELNQEEILAAISRHGTIKNDGGKLVKYLLDNKHYSPLDMVNFTFEIETSRAMGRQILRHASIKFQEHSQRYSSRVEFEDIELRKEDKINRQSSTEVFDPTLFNTDFTNANFWLNDGIINPEQASYLINAYLNLGNFLYDSLLEAGVAKECARFILPECTTTTMSANGTLRSWLSFLNVRQDHHAQKEIQDISNIIGEILSKEMPNVFNSIDWKKGMFL